MDLDPKELIDIPGAGRAEVACRAAGAWDEGRAPNAVAWEVEVWATVTVSQRVKVRAMSEGGSDAPRHLPGQRRPGGMGVGEGDRGGRRKP